MEFPHFRIKICGITSVEDAETCVAEGADALGLNFYSHSTRHLRPELAAAVAKSIPADVVKVGLFVNASANEILAARSLLELDAVQLHGDESPEFLAQLNGIPLMRAFRCGPDLSPVLAYLSRCADLKASPGAVLLDAYHPGQFGGTGVVADWGAIAALRQEFSDYHLVLAGGLTATNVANAIATVRPSAVDSASGVETAPGRKSHELVRAFVAEANGAFHALTYPGL